ncbi:MAG: tRNA (N6-isopentenyl adenosine(37)-C2)-methylthiotransferase MiaB [Atribacterota bacterium]
MMDRNVSFRVITFGCQMNKSRSEHLSYLFSQSGFVAASRPEEADILIFNTCAVREHAVERAVNAMNQMVTNIVSRKGKAPVVVVCGCMSELLREKLMQKIPLAKLLAGTQRWDVIPSLLRENLDKEGQICFFDSEEPAPFLESGYIRESRTFAYLPITYGCDNFCSYCVVPYVTGRQRSKPGNLVLEELGNILQEGFPEVILLGQNVNSYGKDLRVPHTFEHLLDDIERLFGKEEIWVRFITSHPKDMRKSIIERVQGSAIFCPYFHLPLQAGSDRILSLMNRGYTQRDYLKMADLIRNSFPDVGIGTDIIVGFPGETEKDFRETLKVVEAIQFDIAYTYIYSPRPLTASARLWDDVPQRTKEERLRTLNALLREIYLRKIEKRLGTTVEVLVEKEEDVYYVAHTRSNLRVHLKKNGGVRPGRQMVVRLQSLQGTKVEGEVTTPAL